MKNVEKADRIHLGGLIDELKKGNYMIPDFQRDFEWQPWDVESLIKSIFRDYYIGTLLLWKGSKDNFKVLSCESIYGSHASSNPQHIVLDGQQRLTAIHYAFFQPDIPFPDRSKPAVYYLHIPSFLEEDFEEAIWYEFLTKDNIKFLNDPNWQYEEQTFPLGVMKEGSWGTSDWIKGYRDYWLEVAENEVGDDNDSQQRKQNATKYAESAKHFKEAIEEMFNQYYISYIELDKDIDIAKVCDIFTQINSKGVRLDIFDLLNAMLRPKEVFLKNMWKDAKKKLDYTDPKKMKIYVLQVMSILEQAYCSPMYLYYLVPESTKIIKKTDGTKEVVNLIDSSETFIDKWNISVKALESAIKSLQSPRDYGAINANFVPYPSIIPAFAAIKQYVADLKSSKKLDIQTKIRKWYWASIFTNRYSSSVESTSAKDFQALKKWFEDDGDELEVISEFMRSFKEIDLLHENPKGSAIYNAIFNLFVINEARDWSTFDLPEYESLDDHHIVPHSVFHEQAGKSINSILNRTPLSSGTNRHIIRNRMPNEYIREMLDNNNHEKVYQVLESHLISKKAVDILLRNPFTKSDFEEFLIERNKTILDAIEGQLIKEKMHIPTPLKALDSSIEQIELAIRNMITNSLNGVSSSDVIPDHISVKVEKRIDVELRKKPSLNKSDFESLEEKLRFFDLFELYSLIVSKQNWPHFESTFGTKPQLESRFGQLSSLRNGIRHSRNVSSIEKHDGEAAIAWFNEIFSK